MARGERGRVSWPTARDRCKAVVLATGTFLGATMFRGEERWSGDGRERARQRAGRADPRTWPCRGRLKTGTPPRLDGRTIDWSRTGPQPSDRLPWTMALAPKPRSRRNLLVQSLAPMREVMTSFALALERSPLFAGAIEGTGATYCPSIEDKVHRFGDRDGHQISSSRKASTRTWSIPTGFRPRCRPTFKWIWYGQHRRA